MRIVSQDGYYDLPYEQTVVLREETHILVRTMEYEDLRIASYSTKEKAIKAMEMCRKRYTQYIFNRHMIPETANVLTRIPLEEAEKVRDQITETFIFQFPKEEEIEDE